MDVIKVCATCAHQIYPYEALVVSVRGQQRLPGDVDRARLEVNTCMFLCVPGQGSFCKTLHLWGWRGGAADSVHVIRGSYMKQMFEVRSGFSLRQLAVCKYINRFFTTLKS